MNHPILRRAAMVIGLLLAAAALAIHAVGMGGIRIDMLDIGQGDAILVSDGRRQLLVDASPDGTVLARLGAAMPFADRTLEYALVTHPHADHYNGLRWVLGRYRVETLLISDFTDVSEYYKEVLRDAEAHGTRIVPVARGDVIPVSDALHADVLWPLQRAAPADPNESSIVLSVRIAGSDGPALAILTGDATVSVEAALVADDAAALRAHVLKAGHHGSTTSSSAEFIEAVGAKEVLVSVGEPNGYGHPSPSVLRRFEAYGYRIWRTDLQGSIRVTPTKDGVRVRSCRVVCWR